MGDGIGGRRTVSVLFADLVGSTALGEAVDAEVLRRVQTRFYERGRDLVEQHGGQVEKSIGDALMAVFGVPDVREDDALRACRAAAALRDAMDGMATDLLPIEVRIGVATGEVVFTDDPGARDRLVSGDVVNTAARIQSVADAGEVRVDRETARRVRAVADLVELAPISVRGKSLPVVTLRLGSIGTGDAIERRVDTPLVGRDLELRRLHTAVAEAHEQRRASPVLVLGAPGVGKSRVVHELVRGLRAEGVLVMRGRCLPYGTGITFQPLVEMLHEVAGITADDDRATARGRLETALTGAHQGPLVADRLAALAGLDDALVPGEEVGWAVRRWFEWLATRGPLTIVVDDVQWAEAPLMELLGLAVDLMGASPVAIVLVARPEFGEAHPAWLTRPDATIVRLDALPDATSARLLDGLFPDHRLEPGARDAIAARAEGNALFLEQYTAMLLEDDWLREEGDTIVATRPLSDLPTPPSVVAIVAARLDRLPVEQRSAAARASIAGRIFWWSALRALSPEPERIGLGSVITGLLRRDVVLPERTEFADDDAFRFRHALVRDAAYVSLPKADRALLHEQFADWLQRRAADRLPEFEEVLAYHLDAAVTYRSQLLDDPVRTGSLRERGAAHRLSAGLRAFARGDMTSTVVLLDRAIADLPDDTPAAIAALPWLAKARYELGGTREGIALFEAAIRRAASVGDRRTEAIARSQLAIARGWSDPGEDPSATAQQAEALVEELVATFTALADDQGLALTWQLAAEARWMRAANRDAEVAARQAVAHARAAGDHRLVAEMCALLATGLVTFVPWPRLDALGLALVTEAGGSPVVAARVLTCRALVAAHLDHPMRAAELAAEAIRSCTEIGLPIWAAEAELAAAAEVAYLSGDAAAGAAWAGRAATRFRTLQARTYVQAADAYRALLLVVGGEDAEARELIGRSRTEVSGASFASGSWSLAEALLDARAGSESGLAAARTEVGRYPDLPATLDELEAAIRRRDGDEEAAESLLRRALEAWRQAGSIVLQRHVARAIDDPAWPGERLERVWRIEPSAEGSNTVPGVSSADARRPGSPLPG